MFEISHTAKIVASAIATVIALVAYVPYIIDMFRGKNKPHLYTWISIFIITAVVAYLQVVGKAGVGAIPVVLGVAVDAIILFYCFRFGTKDIVFMDKVCLMITTVGVGFYLIFHNQPVLSLLIVTIAEIISFIPTVRKTRNDPYSESLPSYYLILGKLLFILIALQTYNWLTVSYPALWMTVFVLFLAAVYRWRAQAKSKRPHQAVEDAPLV